MPMIHYHYHQHNTLLELGWVASKFQIKFKTGAILPIHSLLFSSAIGADLLKLSRTDLVQICGTADGIRLSNALKARCLPDFIYTQFPGGSIYQELYLEELTATELTNKLAELLSFPASQIQQVSRQGPTGIHILLSDQMVRNLPDESCFVAAVIKVQNTEGYHLVLK
ncbi:hypothetical protein JD844_002186 [Phrynosoma platyrhinos]|uniref:Uncharacterized protein n=1 Tax=Phrynosoma platyrhinos TaxID=52577 RepID=A0ABQ7TAZ0_PHRPL|nr:hypothetical protein JD844_002186 [Phrynosoma platyrhinos]